MKYYLVIGDGIVASQPTQPKREGWGFVVFHDDPTIYKYEGDSMMFDHPGSFANADGSKRYLAESPEVIKASKKTASFELAINAIENEIQRLNFIALSGDYDKIVAEAKRINLK